MARYACAALSWLVASLALCSVNSFAQSAAPDRVPTVSRLVAQFADRETQLAARFRAGDARGAGQWLTDDFELRDGSQPGRPVPREEFIRQSIQSPGSQGTPAQMAVHDLGDTMAVSFLQAGAARHDVFIVDVWRREGDEWKLAIRYAAPAGLRDSAAKGAPPEPAIRKKY